MHFTNRAHINLTFTTTATFQVENFSLLRFKIWF